MRGDIEDFKTGWFGISFGLRISEINLLIDRLQKLKHKPDFHFHFRSKIEDTGGIADVEIYSLGESSVDNLQIE